MDHKDTDPNISPRLMRKLCWRLAPLMFFMYFMSSLDRANIGYAALTMNEDLGMRAQDFGYAASLFFLGYLLFQVPSNLMLHRIGARIWLAIILVFWGAASSLTSLVPNVYWLCVMRFILGVCEAGLFPGLVLYLTDWLPSRNRVWIMSLMVAAMPMAAVVGAPISTALMTHTSVFGMSGWRSMLLLEGLPSIVLGLIVFFILPSTPKQASWLGKAERDELETAIHLEKAKAPSTLPSDASVWIALTNPKIWALSLVYFGIGAGILILLYFLPQVIKSFESAYGVTYTVFEVGGLTAIPFGFATVGMLWWSKFAGKRRVTAVHVVVPLLVCAASLGVALYLPSPIAAMTAFTVASAACFAAQSPFWQLPSRYLIGKAAATGIGLISALGLFLSGVLLPYLVGWIKDTSGSFGMAFLVVAGFMVFSAIIALLLDAKSGSVAILEKVEGSLHSEPK